MLTMEKIDMGDHTKKLLALAFAALVTSGADLASADDPCDSGCNYDSVISPPKNVLVPLNVRLLVVSGSVVSMVDGNGTAIGLTPQTAGTGYDWLTPSEDLMPDTEYTVDTTRTFRTTSARDDEPPSTPTVTIDAASACGSLEYVTVTTQASNEEHAVTQVQSPGDTVFVAGIVGYGHLDCVSQSDGNAYNATVTVYDLAGNAAEPLTVNVTPEDSSDDSGCSLRPGPVDDRGLLAMLTLALGCVLAARRRRRLALSQGTR
jgi:hypothetical protein